jgi:hypothetical protein
VRVTELPCRTLLMRAKGKLANDDEQGLAELKSKVLNDFALLEAQYQ